MNTLEQAFKKLDRIEQNLNDQAEEITQKDHIIAEKDNQITQLYKLFQGSAKIFRKQHNYVDELKKQLEKEAEDKNLSQEQVKHLQKDVETYTNWKNELVKKIEELEAGESESKKIRDKEIADLKETIKKLTEVKMKRQESEEKLKKQSEEFLQVQKVHEQVYNILGECSKKTGLLLRSREVVDSVKWTTINLKINNHLANEKEIKEEIEGWKDEKGHYETLVKHLAKSKKTKIAVRIYSLLEKIFAKDVKKYTEQTLKEDIKTLTKLADPSKSKKNENNDEFFMMTEKICDLLTEYQKELSWWDKWMKSNADSVSKQKNLYDIFRNQVRGVDFPIYYKIEGSLNKLLETYNNGSTSKVMIKALYGYYRDK